MAHENLDDAAAANHRLINFVININDQDTALVSIDFSDDEG